MSEKKVSDAGVQFRFVKAEALDDLRKILADTWEEGFRAAQSMNEPDYDEPALFNRPWTDGDERNPYRKVGELK